MKHVEVDAKAVLYTRMQHLLLCFRFRSASTVVVDSLDALLAGSRLAGLARTLTPEPADQRSAPTLAL